MSGSQWMAVSVSSNAAIMSRKITGTIALCFFVTTVDVCVLCHTCVCIVLL